MLYRIPVPTLLPIVLQTLNNLAVTYALDLWSFGCVLYQMLVGRPPFRDGSEYLTFQKISAGKFDLPDSVAPEAASLLRKLLVLRPEDRLGAPGHAAGCATDHLGGFVPPACYAAGAAAEGTAGFPGHAFCAAWQCALRGKFQKALGRCHGPRGCAARACCRSCCSCHGLKDRSVSQGGLR